MTERVECGTLVTCNSYRNPNLLADIARFVDHISNGRLLLELGNRGFRKDYDEYGYPFGIAGERPRALDRAMPVVEERLGGQLNWLPARADTGLDRGGGKVTLRIVAEYVNIRNGLTDPREAGRKSRVLVG